MLSRHVHTIVLSTVSLLITIGLLMIASNDLSRDIVNMKPFEAYWFRQVVWMALGSMGCFLITKVPTSMLRDMAWFLCLLALLLLSLALIPSVGIEVSGATRWIGWGPFRVQPSEISKIGLVLYAAYFLSARDEKSGRTYMLVPLLIIIGLIAGLVYLAPDLGGAFVILCVSLIMLYTASIPTSFLMGAVISVLPLGMYAVLKEGYQFRRILSFLDPWSDPLGYGYQGIQSIVAFAQGGLFGNGYGRSVQKFFYVPESHTDFIFSIIGEEFGFMGTAFVLFLFLLLALAGYTIAMNANDSFSRFLAIGATSLIVIPALINICITIGLLPISGIPLTFISYGGSSLLVNLAAVGMLLRIHYESAKGTTGD